MDRPSVSFPTQISYSSITRTSDSLAQFPRQVRFKSPNRRRKRHQSRRQPAKRSPGFSESVFAKISLLPVARLGDWRLEFDVEDRVRHRDGLIGRGTIPFFERDFVGYRVAE